MTRLISMGEVAKLRGDNLGILEDGIWLQGVDQLVYGYLDDSTGLEVFTLTSCLKENGLHA